MAEQTKLKKVQGDDHSDIMYNSQAYTSKLAEVYNSKIIVKVNNL